MWLGSFRRLIHRARLRKRVPWDMALTTAVLPVPNTMACCRLSRAHVPHNRCLLALFLAPPFARLTTPHPTPPHPHNIAAFSASCPRLCLCLCLCLCLPVSQGVLLSMVVSIDGFRIREHFVSYGYGFSVALQVSILHCLELGVLSCCWVKMEAVVISRPLWRGNPFGV